MDSCTSRSLISIAAEVGHRRFDLQRQVDADALAAEADFFDGAVERLLFSADADDFQRDRRIGLLERGDRELIPSGERHVGDDANLFLPRRLVEQLIGFAQRGREIGRAVGDLTAGNFLLQHVFLVFQAKGFLAVDVGWNHRGAVAVAQIRR